MTNPDITLMREIILVLGNLVDGNYYPNENEGNNFISGTICNSSREIAQIIFHRRLINIRVFKGLRNFKLI